MNTPEPGFLLELSKANRISYLFGTFHVGEHASFPGPMVLRAIEEATAIALENKTQDPQVFADALCLKNIVKLPKGLNKKYEAAIAKANNGRFPIGGRFELAMTFLARPLLVELGIVGEGSEAAIRKLAAALGKEVEGLESPNDSIETFLRDSKDQVIKHVELGLRRIEDGTAKNQLASLRSAWEKNELDVVDRVMRDICSDEPILSKKFEKRDRAMSVELSKLHDAKTVFAAVGALHISGMIRELQALGFETNKLL